MLNNGQIASSHFSKANLASAVHARLCPHSGLFSLAALLLLLLGSGFPASAQSPPKNSCLDCHATLDPPLRVLPEEFSQDIHAQKGLNCSACHGGDPSNDDMTVAMSPAAHFRGKIERRQIPELCAGCHSDNSYMRQFNPSLRTDQLAQYKTSVHGKRLEHGDTKVAVCTDCHGLHNLRPATDTRSRVHPLNVAQTCARCHADAEYMKEYKIPTDQYASYTSSVHHEAIALRGDLSAPTCTTCHGNHGAAPPGVSSIEFVCSTCHVFQAQLFDASPHKNTFAAMSLPACVTCHSNHRILHPSDAMIGTDHASVCLRCHSSGDPGFEAAAAIHSQLDKLRLAIENSNGVLLRAEDSGMEVSQAKLEADRARDALTKARVTVHSFSVAPVAADVDTGLKVSDQVMQAGLAALAERNYRRKGLAVSVLAIFVVLAGLWLLIREIESGPGKS